MTELLENSDNTNESAVVSESPANEATISLAVARSLADALQKIESYTPTVWVDNESPDIDAAHLNKEEQAIMRVTTAMNSAVDVIKDLQSQINTTNNNLSNTDGRVTQLYSDLGYLNSATVKHYSDMQNVFVQVYKANSKYYLQIIFEIEGQKKTLSLSEFTL